MGGRLDKEQIQHTTCKLNEAVIFQQEYFPPVRLFDDFIVQCRQQRQTDTQFDYEPNQCVIITLYVVTFQLNPYATDLSEAQRCLAYSLTAGATAALVYTVIFQAIHLFISIAPTVTEVVHEVDQCICACVCVCAKMWVFVSHHGKPQRPNNNVAKLLNMA